MFGPAHDEVPAGQVLEVIDEEQVYCCPAGGFDYGHGQSGRHLGHAHPEACLQLRDQPQEGRSPLLRRAPLGTSSLSINGFQRVELRTFFYGFPREVKVHTGIGPFHTRDRLGR